MSTTAQEHGNGARKYGQFAATAAAARTGSGSGLGAVGGAQDAERKGVDVGSGGGDQVEVGGEWAQDETGARDGAKESWLKGVSAEQHLEFLARRPPATRGEALRGMTRVERMIFRFLIVLQPIAMLASIWSLPQKSEAWKWARTGRITGSSTGAAVGQQRKTRVLKAAYGSVYLRFKGSAATEWGSGKEIYATRCYVNNLIRVVTAVFREQRRSGAVLRSASETDDGSMFFVFRNQRIPVPDINKDPEIEVWHIGLGLEPTAHWRGVSPDGVIFINGVACGVLEIKCSYGKGKSLYTNIRQYYYNQLMCEMYLANCYWPTIKWLDFVVWSPRNFTLDTFVFDAQYFYTWYLPRELRYYFQALLPTIAELVLYHARLAAAAATVTTAAAATVTTAAAAATVTTAAAASVRQYPGDEHVRTAMRQLFGMPKATTATSAPEKPNPPNHADHYGVEDDPAFLAALGAMDLPTAST